MNAHALIVGKFAPLHAGHCHLIDTALGESHALTVMVYSNPDFADMPQAVRAGWIGALYPQVAVLTPEDPPLDSADDRTHRVYVKEFLRSRGLEVDAVYTSEDYGDGFAAVLGVRHRMVDRMRTSFPISGTMVRADVCAGWRFLPAPVREHFRRVHGVDMPLNMA